MRAVASSAFIFPGRYAMSQPLSAAAFLQFVKREMGMTVTLHGFRSSFRDWAGDETSFPREVCEAALGHTVTGVEGAYRRSDALAKRRLLMDAWAAYCDSPSPGDENAADNVLSFETRSARAKA
jgi:integrase